MFCIHLNRFEIELSSFSSSTAMPWEEWKRKRLSQSVQGSKWGAKRVLCALKERPKSSAQPVELATWINLTLFDWVTVYAYVDTLTKPINQQDMVNYFATRPEGALKFTQSTLSCKLQHRPEMEAHVHSNPNALSSKRPHIITRPDVDRALWMWVKHMEKKRWWSRSGASASQRDDQNVSYYRGEQYGHMYRGSTWACKGFAPIPSPSPEDEQGGRKADNAGWLLSFVVDF